MVKKLIGRRVRVRPTGEVRTIVAIYNDIPGGVRLDQATKCGFVSWNMDELILLKKDKKHGR